MERRIMNLNQYKEVHKIQNNIKNINKTRIIVMGKAYSINKDTLQTYKFIGDVIGAGLMVGMFYLIYCMMWILG